MIANMAMIGTLTPNSQRLCQHTGYVSAAFSYLLLAGERATTNRFPDLWELLFCYEIEINCVNRINLTLLTTTALSATPLSATPSSHPCFLLAMPLSATPSSHPCPLSTMPLLSHTSLIHAPSQPHPPLIMPLLNHALLTTTPLSTTRFSKLHHLSDISKLDVPNVE